MHFELWRLDTNNLQGDWDSEDEALRGSLEILRHRRGPLEVYALARHDRRGFHDVAAGRELLDLAERRAKRSAA